MLFSAAAALLVLFLNADAKSLTRGRGSRGYKISRPRDSPGSARADEIPMEEIDKLDRLPAAIAASVGNLIFVDGCEIAVLFQSWGEEDVRKYRVAFKRGEKNINPFIATCEKRHAEWIPDDKDFAELLEGFTTKAGSCLEIFDFLFNRAVAINKKLRNEVGNFQGKKTLKRHKPISDTSESDGGIDIDERRGFYFGKLLCDYIYQEAPLRVEE